MRPASPKIYSDGVVRQYADHRAARVPGVQRCVTQLAPPDDVCARTLDVMFRIDMVELTNGVPKTFQIKCHDWKPEPVATNSPQVDVVSEIEQFCLAHGIIENWVVVNAPLIDHTNGVAREIYEIPADVLLPLLVKQGDAPSSAAAAMGATADDFYYYVCGVLDKPNVATFRIENATPEK